MKRELWHACTWKQPIHPIKDPTDADRVLDTASKSNFAPTKMSHARTSKSLCQCPCKAIRLIRLLRWARYLTKDLNRQQPRIKGMVSQVGIAGSRRKTMLCIYVDCCNYL